MRRTNEEFKAEVFSRSEKYIKQRKDRRKKAIIALSCIVPCVLCIAILLPHMSQKNGGIDNALMDNMFAPSMKEEAMEQDIGQSVGSSNGSDGAFDIIADEDGTEGAVTIRISVAEYPNSGDNFHETRSRELVRELDSALKKARGANVGIYDYNILGDLDGEGFEIILHKDDGSSQQYIIVENYLFVDNVAYAITEDDAYTITTLAENAQLLY